MRHRYHRPDSDCEVMQMEDRVITSLGREEDDVVPIPSEGQG
jgi:hypothetical protein